MVGARRLRFDCVPANDNVMRQVTVAGIVVAAPGSVKISPQSSVISVSPSSVIAGGTVSWQKGRRHGVWFVHDY